MVNLENYIKEDSLVDEEKSKVLQGYSKRYFDLLCSLIGIVVLSPLFLLIAIIVKASSKGNVFFIQERLGKKGKIIKIYKFRTMIINAEEILESMPLEKKKEFEENYKFNNDLRITKVGKFLRESSLDELPQLLNIIKGDMSLVGPRPIVEREIEKYGNNAGKLLSVKPGLTGNWQVNGRNNTTYEERVILDMEYIDNSNFFKDVFIILKTFGVVIKKVGAK